MQILMYKQLELKYLKIECLQERYLFLFKNVQNVIFNRILYLKRLLK